MTDMTATIDQMSTMIENIGQVTANLYARLIIEGIPPDLASDLIRTWWDIYWTNSFQKIAN